MDTVGVFFLICQLNFPLKFFGFLLLPRVCFFYFKKLLFVDAQLVFEDTIDDLEAILFI